MSIKKGTIPPRYEEAFKTGAIKMVTEQWHSPKEVAAELGICVDTLRYWLKNTEFQPTKTDGQSRNDTRQRALEAEMHSFRKQLAKKDKVIYMRKICPYIFKTTEDKYYFIDTRRSQVSTEKSCRSLEVSRSGYYTWKNRSISI